MRQANDIPINANQRQDRPISQWRKLAMWFLKLISHNPRRPSRTFINIRQRQNNYKNGKGMGRNTYTDIYTVIYNDKTCKRPTSSLSSSCFAPSMRETKDPHNFSSSMRQVKWDSKTARETDRHIDKGQLAPSGLCLRQEIWKLEALLSHNRCRFYTTTKLQRPRPRYKDKDKDKGPRQS